MKKASKRSTAVKSRETAAKKGGSVARVVSAPRRLDDDEMRPEYDFSGGVRGKYADRFARGQSVRVVVLAPDVAEAFTSAREVNAALRRLIKTTPPTGGSRRSNRRTA
jgi:hypothetical protein